MAKPAGIFGETATTAPAAGGLFGSKPATDAAKPVGAFGAPPSIAPAGGMFGSKPATDAEKPVGGMFGAPPTTASAAAGGLLGSKLATDDAKPSAFGSSEGETKPAAVGGMFGGASA